MYYHNNPQSKQGQAHRIIMQYILMTGNIGGRMKSIFTILALLLTILKNSAHEFRVIQLRCNASSYNSQHSAAARTFKHSKMVG